MQSGRIRGLIFALLLTTCLFSWGQEKRRIIIDQDAAGPAGTDLQSTLLLIQSPQTEVLGVTVVTGDAWLKSEVAHTLRMLELIGRTDIPVVPGAEYPLVRAKEAPEPWAEEYGAETWRRAWSPRVYYPPDWLEDRPGGKTPTTPAERGAVPSLVSIFRT